MTSNPASSAARCCILVPVGDHIEPDCERSLSELERRGYAVRRVRGYAAIDQGRSQMATDALRDGFHELLWIDSDIGFDPEEVERLRGHPHSIVCGIYPKKGLRELACHLLPGTKKITFGRDGGVIELKYAATGFLLTRAEVYRDIQTYHRLPECNTQFGRAVVPYFLPLIADDERGPWYLGEDYAFCHRARAAGHAVMADTRIRLWHIGRCNYGWEDAGSDRPRFARYDFEVTP